MSRKRWERLILSLSTVTALAVSIWFLFVGSNKDTEVDQLKVSLEIARSELHTMQSEAVMLGYAYWEGVDVNVAHFNWKDPEGKLSTYRRPEIEK